MKSIGLAYFLWFFFGFHRFYLNRPFTAILYWFTCGGLGVWVLLDLFLIPSMVEEENREWKRTMKEIAGTQIINVTVDNSTGKRSKRAKNDFDFS